jgi:branched-chain amino acid transport system substrate-binding protein
MKKAKGISLLTFSITLAVALILCTTFLSEDGRAAEKPIEIGYIMPMTGPVSATGDISHKGAQFAVDKINAAGGIKSLGGRKLKLLVGDSEGKAEVGVNQAERLIRAGVVGLQGTAMSSIAYPATAVAERHKTPFLVSMAYSDPITERGFKYTFRLCMRNYLVAIDLFDFTKDLYKAFGAPFKTAAWIMDDTIYGKTQSEAFEKVFGKAGIKILDKIFYPVGSTDLSSEVMRAKRADADAFLMHAFPSDAILIVKTMREMGFNPKAVITPGGAPKVASFVKAVGKLSDYMYTLNDTNWDVSARAKEVNEKFKKRYGFDLSGLSLYEYLGILVWREVLEKAGSTDREKIRETFAMIEITAPEIIEVLPYDKIKFGPDGQNKYVKATMAMLKNAELRTVWPEKNASMKWVFPAPTWEEKLK